MDARRALSTGQKLSSKQLLPGDAALNESAFLGSLARRHTLRCSHEAWHGFRAAGMHEPAIEYSWKRNLGLLLGARFIPAGRNANAAISPAIAINFVHLLGKPSHAE